MSTPITLYRTTGVAAVDMSVELLGQWVTTKVGQPITFQSQQGAGATGTWTVQGTNTSPPLIDSAASTAASTLYWSTPTQPAGSAGETSITVQATHDYMRCRYVPGSGGTGVLPVVRAALGAGGVLVIPPDIAVTPAASIATLAGLGASTTVASGVVTRFKIASATLLATPVAGTLENDGTHLYWTDDGGTRRTLY